MRSALRGNLWRAGGCYVYTRSLPCSEADPPFCAKKKWNSDVVGRASCLSGDDHYPYHEEACHDCCWLECYNCSFMSCLVQARDCSVLDQIEEGLPFLPQGRLDLVELLPWPASALQPSRNQASFASCSFAFAAFFLGSSSLFSASSFTKDCRTRKKRVVESVASSGPTRTSMVRGGASSAEHHSSAAPTPERNWTEPLKVEYPSTVATWNVAYSTSFHTLSLFCPLWRMVQHQPCTHWRGVMLDQGQG